MKIHHPASVRSVVFSPVHWQPRHAITGLDNGNIYRHVSQFYFPLCANSNDSWDLNMGQRGQLDRIALAHSGPILALDWTLPSSFSSNAGHRTTGSSGSSQGSSNWYAGVGSGLFDDLGSGNATPGAEAESNGNGWLASGGLDRTVKVNAFVWASCEKSPNAYCTGMGHHGTQRWQPHPAKTSLHFVYILPSAARRLAAEL